VDRQRPGVVRARHDAPCRWRFRVDLTRRGGLPPSAAALTINAAVLLRSRMARCWCRVQVVGGTRPDGVWAVCLALAARPLVCGTPPDPPPTMTRRSWSYLSRHRSTSQGIRSPRPARSLRLALRSGRSWVGAFPNDEPGADRYDRRIPAVAALRMSISWRDGNRFAGRPVSCPPLSLDAPRELI
jgi:hypothetical protein